MLTGASNTKSTVQRDTAFSEFEVLLPEHVGVRKTEEITVKLEFGNHKVILHAAVPAERYWNVYIYPHSHVDIGYTGLQEDVSKIHTRNIDVGIDLAAKTQHYPTGSRFIWNTESAWVVDRYLKSADPARKKKFFDAVKKGWIRIDAGHSNINTSICSDEELMHFFDQSNSIEKSTGVPVNTMVQMDVPGAAWGIVDAAVHNGVKGFISFPNYYDRRKMLEHKPFYWLGPDGKSKILFYKGFHMALVILLKEIYTG
nr:hypothetical protein [Niabella ginsengisoli]